MADRSQSFASYLLVAILLVVVGWAVHRSGAPTEALTPGVKTPVTHAAPIEAGAAGSAPAPVAPAASPVPSAQPSGVIDAKTAPVNADYHDVPAAIPKDEKKTEDWK